MSQSNALSLFLCGDVMTGRGIDQILPHPATPVLYERWVRDARHYVELAECAHGRIPRPAAIDYVWGDALEELKCADPGVRIINLETSVTSCEDHWPEKDVHYRMHPQNIGCIGAAGIDCCCLANNHVIDWGYRGLEETLQTLDAAGIRRAGAGRNAADAMSPAELNVPGKGRVLVFAFGSTTSGIPVEWAATDHRPGVNLLKDLTEDTARNIGEQIRQCKQPGDVIVASIHWGSNWGYAIPKEQVDFAHRLVEEGVAIVYGHSSHHVRPIEVYRERLILYGCGDFLNDYEGIGGFEEFRGDLTSMYFVTIDPEQGRLQGLRLVPMQIRRCRLQRASASDVQRLCDVLNQQSMRFGTQAFPHGEHGIGVRWK
jgi:poly-gamma-glutamate synthesis protein (capsule biosynthesis protein)